MKLQPRSQGLALGGRRERAWERDETALVQLASYADVLLARHAIFSPLKDCVTSQRTSAYEGFVQLGVETSSLVLHICHMDEFPKSLTSLLRDENILKVRSSKNT